MEKTLSDQSFLVERSITRLDNWLTRNGWVGYDPYDLEERFVFTVPQPTLTQDALRRAIRLTELIFPVAFRRALRIPKRVNAKAMGLFAAGYQILYEATKNEAYLNKAREALTWLEENSSQGYTGLCWGHPFSWQSRILITKNTPSSVITAVVGDSFWRFYRMTGHTSYLTSCQSICEFFLNDLNIDGLGEGKICFSKTPLDHFHIHNSNLFVADFLLKVGEVSQRREYIKAAWKALTYTMGEQNDDGSISYWGKDQGEQCRIDHYHTGFGIRSLYSIWKSTADERVLNSLKKYYQFYREKLFTSKGIPKMTPNALYPINVHSCAEAILCHSTLAPDFPEAQGHLQKCIPWIVKTMQHPEGWFIYMIREIKWRLRWKQKVPYIRWGQAWMLRALAECYSWIRSGI